MTAGAVAPAAAQQDCYDLWHARNLIHTENGFCFSTDMARQVFADHDYWTKNPHLTPRSPCVRTDAQGTIDSLN